LTEIVVISYLAVLMARCSCYWSAKETINLVLETIIFLDRFWSGILDIPDFGVILIWESNIP